MNQKSPVSNRAFPSSILAPRPGLEPGTCGLTVPASICIAERIIPQFLGRFCLIFFGYPQAGKPHKY